MMYDWFYYYDKQMMGKVCRFLHQCTPHSHSILNPNFNKLISFGIVYYPKYLQYLCLFLYFIRYLCLMKGFHYQILLVYEFFLAF